ncbi:hypothetical protein HOF78_00130 [Candidatus Woesearchaeota archaeon]|nr:hypothetical protein [Candidatus Woesearchaeota archaeon]
MNPKNFRTFKAESEVRIIGRMLAHHLFKEGINRVMFIDRSARPGYIALKKAWKKKFPGVPTPEIYFTNPEGYNTQNRSENEVVEEFDSTYRRLASDKESSIMLFDGCVHSGNSMRPIQRVLERAGYSDVRLGLAQPKDYGDNKDLEIDFQALSRPSWNTCYPFRRDNMIERNRTSVLSSRNGNQGDRLASIELRREISSLF